MKKMKFKFNARLGALKKIALAAVALCAFNVNQAFGQWNTWCYKDYGYIIYNNSFN